MGAGTSPVDRQSFVVVSNLCISSILNQNLYDVRRSLNCSMVKGSHAKLVDSIGIALVILEQSLDNVQLPVAGCTM